jgi:glycosyltransferase involved in cell wall biosynthesis
MIITDVGGLTELVPHGKTGLIGQPNPDCMVHQIREIFKPGVLQRMSENMKSFKEKFSWPSMVKSLESATK